MKTKQLLMTVALVAAAACGSDRAAPSSEKAAAKPAAATEGATLPEPIPFEKHEGRFYDEKHSSFFTIYGLAEGSKTRYQAFGVDLDAQQVVFNIELENRHQLLVFLKRVNAEIARLGAIRENAIDAVRHGIAGEADIQVPPRPRGGGDQYAGALIHTGNIATQNQLNFFSGAYFPRE